MASPLKLPNCLPKKKLLQNSLDLLNKIKKSLLLNHAKPKMELLGVLAELLNVLLLLKDITIMNMMVPLLMLISLILVSKPITLTLKEELSGETISLILITKIVMDTELIVLVLSVLELGVLLKKTTLIAVKVLNCAGSGSYAGVINGINWCVTSQRSRGRKSVANMSLGGPLFQAVNDAVDAASRAGIAMIVAGGNDNNDACKYSPASASTAITCGATEVQDRSGNQIDLRSSYSNYGTCIDIFAPGTQITSTWINSGTRTISGTSMATPHVCGAAAVYFHKNPTHSIDQLLVWLRSNGNQDMIDLNCAIAACRASPNLLLHSSCDLGM